MKAFNGYEQAKTIVEQERLPAGGYVVIIKNAEEVSGQHGSRLVISFDILEGDFKDYFATNYRNQTMEDKKWKGVLSMFVPVGDGSDKDNMTMSIFKTNILAIEESNPGYHWDWNEAGLKGKIVGARFRNKEYNYNGHQGMFTECFDFKPAEVIRGGKFKIPKDKLLPKSSVPSFNPADFTEIGNESDLPF